LLLFGERVMKDIFRFVPTLLNAAGHFII